MSPPIFIAMKLGPQQAKYAQFALECGLAGVFLVMLVWRLNCGVLDGCEQGATDSARENGARLLASNNAKATIAKGKRTQSISSGLEYSVLQLGCINKLSHADTRANFVRLSFQLCSANKHESIRIANETKGLKLAHFEHVDSQTLSTDFFPLQDGMNKITVTLSDSKKYTFNIQRKN